MPRRFVFDLQPVLDQRERVEEEHQRRVGEVERERVAIEDRLKGLQQAIIAAKDDLRATLTPEARLGGQAVAHVVVHAVRQQSTASAHLLARAQQAVLELAGVHKRLEAARRELVAAAAARKAVELLKARRYQEWRRALSRFEHAELDELVVMRHGLAAKPWHPKG